MEITQGPKITTPLSNHFDDDMTTTSREVLFDGKRYSDLTPTEQRPAMAAWRAKRRKDRVGWAYLTGLAGFCLLCAAHLTAFGVVFVLAVIALTCTALVRTA